jgi:hypothetical protein
MHFGIALYTKVQQMQKKETIEDLISRELKGLCATCLHANTCVYYATTTKAIIQCEMFQVDHEQQSDSDSLHGLCRTCDHALYCSLPGRKGGVWRCNEFI